MTEQDKKRLAKALNDYIELKRNQAECTGFIDGFEKAIEYMNQGLLLPKHNVVYCPLCNSDNTTVESDGIWCNGCDEWTSTKE